MLLKALALLVAKLSKLWLEAEFVCAAVLCEPHSKATLGIQGRVDPLWHSAASRDCTLPSPEQLDVDLAELGHPNCRYRFQMVVR